MQVLSCRMTLVSRTKIFRSGSAVENAFFSDSWPAVVHVGDCEIVPVAAYDLQATEDGSSFSEPLEIETIAMPTPKKWADVAGSLGQRFRLMGRSGHEAQPADVVTQHGIHHRTVNHRRPIICERGDKACPAKRQQREWR